MLKKTTLLLCVVAFSATLGLADDDLEVLWEEPYAPFPIMSGAFKSWGEYYTQDDFILDTDALIKAIECWAIYTPFDDEDDHPQPFRISIRYDHYGMPGGLKLSASLPLQYIDETDTGDVYGYGEDAPKVWHYRFDFSGWRLDGGTPWWLEIRTEAQNFAWGARSVGNLYHQWNEHFYSAFFRLLGHFEETAVQSASWGEIKAGFVD